MKVIIKRSDENDDEDLTGQHTFFFTVSVLHCDESSFYQFYSFFQTLANKKLWKSRQKGEQRDFMCKFRKKQKANRYINGGNSNK